MSGQEPIRNIIEELLLTIGILSSFEEEFKVLENVLKQVVCHQFALHGFWKFIQSIWVLVDGSKSIIGPEVIKMLWDLVIKTSWKWFLIGESGQERQPVSQTLCFVLKAHLLLLIVNDFNNTWHNVGKEYNTAKHVTNSHENFNVTNRIIVTISNRRKSGHGVIPTHNNFPVYSHFINLKFIVECRRRNLLSIFV